MDKHGELEAFVAVVQQGGFSAAARKLGLTPSAVSKQVGRLEQRLGVSLLHRNTRGVTPTEVGRAYFEGGHAIVQRLAVLEDSVTRHHRRPQGLVRVSVSHGLARLELIEMLRGFHVRYPDVRVVLELDDSFVDLVGEGIDLAIRAGELSDSSLIARRVAAFQRMIVAAPEYLQAHGVPDSPQALRDHNCLRRSGSQPAVNRWPFVGPQGPESVEVSGNLEASTVETLLDAALAGIGIARVSYLLTRQPLADGRLVALLVDYAVPDSSSLHVVYPSTRHLSRAVRAFIDAFVEHIARAPTTFESVSSSPG